MSYDTIADLNDTLVRKALKGSLFVGAANATALTETNIFDANANLVALPAGYSDGGLTTDEGLRFTRAVENSDITSWQRQTPTRSDKTSDVETVQVDFQELKKTTLDLYTGADLSSKQITVNGTLSIRKPAVPVDRYFRILAVTVDNTSTGLEIVIARFFPRVKVTSYSDQAYSKGDSAINWGMTFTAYMDDALGYSVDNLFGGPGFETLGTDMGFTQAT